VRSYRQRSWFLLLLLLIPALTRGEGGPEELPPAPAPASPLNPDQVFFAAPLGAQGSGLNAEAALDLGLDYAALKYPSGMVNLLDPRQTAVAFRQRVPITELDKILLVEHQAGVKTGEKFTLVTPAGKAYPGSIGSFAYFGNSPSSVLVAAVLRVKLPAFDAQVYSRPGLALRGDRRLPPNSRIRLWPEVKVPPSLAERLRAQAVPPARAGEVIADFRVAPARLSSLDNLDYFVSYWRHPPGAYDLEDMQSAGYLYRVQGEKLQDLNLPPDLQVAAVWDLLGNGQAVVLGTAGDGAWVCHRLYAWDGRAFTLVKEGLCAGY
jgi:hypothetical protein